VTDGRDTSEEFDLAVAEAAKRAAAERKTAEDQALRADEDRDCGTAQIERIAENAPRRSDMNTQSRGFHRLSGCSHCL